MGFGLLVSISFDIAKYVLSPTFETRLIMLFRALSALTLVTFLSQSIAPAAALDTRKEVRSMTTAEWEAFTSAINIYKLESRRDDRPYFLTYDSMVGNHAHATT
jgi:hypothetical protein